MAFPFFLHSGLVQTTLLAEFIYSCSVVQKTKPRGGEKKKKKEYEDFSLFCLHGQIITMTIVLVIFRVYLSNSFSALLLSNLGQSQRENHQLSVYMVHRFKVLNLDPFLETPSVQEELLTWKRFKFIPMLLSEKICKRIMLNNTGIQLVEINFWRNSLCRKPMLYR